jgi:hypothetical protein
MKRKNALVAIACCLAPLFAYTDDRGCQVVLCLSNSQGPTAVAECVPAIEKLWSELAQGHGFPACDMNSGGASGNRAQHQWAAISACNTGNFTVGFLNGYVRRVVSNAGAAPGVLANTVAPIPLLAATKSRAKASTKLKRQSIKAAPKPASAAAPGDGWNLYQSNNKSEMVY